MRNRFCWPLLLGLMLLAGCFGKKASPPAAGAASGHPLIVTPDTSIDGKIVRVENSLQFAVIHFPLARMPEIGQRLVVYRHGLKVGELKISGPQQDDNIIADIVAGDAAPGDEARNR